jgi:hypothetical protein
VYGLLASMAQLAALLFMLLQGAAMVVADRLADALADALAVSGEGEDTAKYKARTCATSDWTRWSACSRTCGVGVQTRQRFSTCTVGTVVLRHHRYCTEKSDVCVQNCQIEPWTAWTHCTRR